jgi:WD40 repeat protein
VFTHWLDGRFFAQARRHFAGPLDEHFSLAFQATCGTMWFDEIEILGDQEPPGTHEGLVEWQALLADPPNAAERWPQLAARLRTSPIERDRLLALAAQGCADTARVPRLPEPLCLPAATQVSWAPDGTRWAQVGPHTQVVVYERTGKRLEHSQTKNVARAVAWSPDGRQLAIGCEDGSCEVRHWPTLTPLNNLVGHRGPVTAVAYAPDSSLLTAGTDGKVLRRAAATGQAVGGSEQFAPGGIRLLGTSPSGERIAHTVAGVMVKKQLLTRHDPATAAHHRSAITADGTLMATWSCSTRINWFDLATKQITDGPSLAPWLIAELAISSDKRYFAVNQLNGQVLLFGRHTRQPIARSEWLGLPSSGLTFAPDGRQLLLTAPDPVGTRLWDLTNVGRAPE